MKFIDEINLSIKSGNGGNGCLSFHREKYINNGWADGGNGGNGGNIIITSNANVNSFLPLTNRKIWKAENGVNGRKKDMHGKTGDNLIINVPVGTLVYYNNELIFDFIESDLSFEIAKGGKGGKGNASFKSSINKKPRQFELGYPGEEKNIRLELRYLADVGIVGKPNVGKSTFLNTISNSKSKVGNYDFTTLSPVLGLVTNNDKKLLFADIPGIISGAHKGKGLGISFLKHVYRCKIILHLLDFSIENKDNPIDDYNQTQEELKKFSPKLLLKPQIIIASKCDILDTKKLLDFKNKFKDKELFEISSLTSLNVSPLINKIFILFNDLNTQKKHKSFEYEEDWKKNIPKNIIYVDSEENSRNNYKILSIGNSTLELKGQLINYLNSKNPLINEVNTNVFFSKLKRYGILKEIIDRANGEFGDKPFKLLILNNLFENDEIKRV